MIPPSIYAIIAVVNLILLIWFIFSINRIKDELRQISIYTRRTALALPLTSGQAKLINRSFTPAELIAIIQKQGGRFRFEKHKGWEDQHIEYLVIDNRNNLDPELLSLAEMHNLEIHKLLKETGSQAGFNDSKAGADSSSNAK